MLGVGWVRVRERGAAISLWLTRTGLRYEVLRMGGRGGWEGGMNGWMEVGRVGGGGSLCGYFCDMLRLTEFVPERLDGSDGSKCAWVKNGFAYDQGLLYRSTP